MKGLRAPWPVPEEFLRALGGENPPALRNQTGLAFFLMRLLLLGRSFFVLTGEDRAETLANDTRSLAHLFEELQGWSIALLPSQAPKEKHALFQEGLSAPGIAWFGSKSVLLEKCLAKREFLEARVALRVGKPSPYSKTLERLSEAGYRRANFVEESGEFAPRGEVFDLWPPNLDRPLRLVFHGDVVETMNFFDPDTQRASDFVPEVLAVPCGRRLASGTVGEYFPDDAILFADDLELEKEPEAPLPEGWNRALPLVRLRPDGRDLGIAPATGMHNHWTFFKKELEGNRAAGLESFVFCQNMGEAERLQDHLDDLRLGPAERPQIVIASLCEGFQVPAARASVWSFGDLVGSPTVIRRMPKFKMGRALDSLSEIRQGDYVVHESYGIGCYRGLERVHLKTHTGRGAQVREKESEFLVLEYRGGDRLLVPIQDLRLIQKYVGAEGKKPQVNSLDRAAWERVKQRVQKEVEDLARELIETAALRSAAARPGESPEGGASLQPHLEKEFADAFPYEETADQRQAIQNVLEDLNSPRLMDHLVCGDVGYGKTEIAMRAAFHRVLEGKQVAVLVPTTILAEQHFKTFGARFAAFPVRIAMLSRFQKPREQKKALEELKKGTVDILIGTHRLLQRDVAFRDLGLVVIDEEHRFGVKQKEQLKKMKLSVDVLSLSATPIPRTLSLSLGGLKRISVVETPPEGRLPIETAVGLFDEQKLVEAVRREVGRGGQVFYVHNRIATIESRKRALEKLAPGLRIGLAHGQMSADALESAMWNFLHKKWDVLLATSIIESGLDIPSVNTLIVEDSQDFGLSQLYQLRGRVGRQKQKAYCYLFFNDWADLSEDARKRLEAIQEFSHLGSGIKLALRDMEIRGTGNLLGSQQHGWIAAVGLDLYCQMLNEEVERLKVERGLPAAEPARPEEDPSLPEIELDVAAYLPETYVTHPGERIALYKRLVHARGAEELDAAQGELSDRFGHPPEPVATLLEVLRLKSEARALGVVQIAETEKGLIIGWRSDPGGLPLDLARFAREHPGDIEILPPDSSRRGMAVLKILYKEGDESDVFGWARKCLQMSSSYATLR